MLGARGVEVAIEKRDGDGFVSGDVLARLSRLAYEASIARARRLESGAANVRHRDCRAEICRSRVRSRNSVTRVVATRKTPWGLLDKRAVHLGGCGTHRIGLGDAILIKNNHLALIATPRRRRRAARDRTSLGRPQALGVYRSRSAEPGGCTCSGCRAFRTFADAVLGRISVLAAARQYEAGRNQPDSGKLLRKENLWDFVLTEASGGIAESNIESLCGMRRGRHFGWRADTFGARARPEPANFIMHKSKQGACYDDKRGVARYFRVALYDSSGG